MIYRMAREMRLTIPYTNKISRDSNRHLRNRLRLVESVTHIGTVSVNESPFISDTAHFPRHDGVSAVAFCDLLCATADGGCHLDADLAADSGLSMADESICGGAVPADTLCVFLCCPEVNWEDELTIDANTHLASSSSQASIISARGITTGSQLQIDFRGGTAKLRGDVASSFSKGTSEK